MVVEDDAALLEAIVDTLELSGCEVLTADCAESALAQLEANDVDIVVSDVNMRGMDGHQLLGEIKRKKPDLPVVLITAYGSIQHSVSAMQNGAADYIVKPFEPDVLTDIVERYALGRVMADKPVAQDATSIALYDLAARVASTDSTVLIAGESGTGKEVLARYVHANSARCDAAFVAINCAAIPESMLEATLFGHEKGAFTGAHQAMPGKFEQADGGTLLLDEISEMDLALQAKLLRVLQEREVERVGGRKTITLDVRIIATTNRDLREHVANGLFREDLYYRLSVFPLTLVPLQQRRDDVVPIARKLLAQHCKKMRRSAAGFSASAELALKNYAWPGNVRELDNVIQRALVLQTGVQIDAGDLMFDTASAMQVARDNTPADANPTQGEEQVPASGMLEDGLKKQEFQIILDALEAARGSRKDAAEALGVSPRTLRYKMARMREMGLLA
ncbi:MAG: sigma-54 dependent transcriptional regulator [Gammaproteobacteria bacterium]|nr:sigma-54 dependent transcriptional regulator [Gammaproteobacteria bacterium]